MRLVKAEISGFGRLASTAVNLDCKVLAVVGANESGKSTLLRALAYVDNRQTLSVMERSRGMSVADDATVVRVQYLVEDADLAAIRHFDLEESPTSIWLSRSAAGGAIEKSVEPLPRKAVAPLERLVSGLRRASSRRLFKVLRTEHPMQPEVSAEGEVEPTLWDRAEDGLTRFFEDVARAGSRTAVAGHAKELRFLASEISDYDEAHDLRDALGAVVEWHRVPEPAAAVAKALWNRTPDIVMFDEADRALPSSVVLSDELVAAPPPALSNLLSMAGLDLQALWDSLTSGDEGERETLVDEANRTLATKFAQAWRQSEITVVLKTEQTALYIRVKQDGKRITQFDERSAGLRMFVALAAFLDSRRRSVPPVLLIDEAETHLHIDAQADLVRTFMAQDRAAKIIYTTHSPACLPPDLGSNIRAVVPSETSEFQSVIQSSFWHGAAGFNPLLLAMGAGAAAFSTARFVVLAEGASEMILLPSLIKAAVDLPDLDYQIAPGLAEVSKDMYADLDLAGARVAYLVDDDAGGRARRKSMVDNGVDADRIVTLGALNLENLLDADAYETVLRALFAECNPGSVLPEPPALPLASDAAWPGVYGRWARQHGLRMPGKRVVASRIIEESLASPSEFGTAVLREVHREVTRVLNRA